MAWSLFKRSLVLLTAAVLVAALVFVVIGMSVMAREYASLNTGALLRASEAVAATSPASSFADPKQARLVCASIAASSGYRVTMILPDGTVIADSEADPATMENHANRPEVAPALRGVATASRRASVTVGDQLIYAAAPVFAETAVPAGAAGTRAEAGVLRLALHEPSLDRALAPSRWAFGAAAFVFAAAALAAAAAFSRMTARPLASLARAARAYGSGEASNT